jgi:chemotaxis protein methyltransferase CheR
MVVREVLGEDPRHDVKILATDIDTAVLARAKAGVYPDTALAQIAPPHRRWLLAGSGRHAGEIRIRDELRALVTFKPLNLFEPWPFSGGFDVIFCRNVMIYFAPLRRAELIDRLRDRLTPTGQLILGHSESLVMGCSGLRLIRRTVYARHETQRLPALPETVSAP